MALLTDKKTKKDLSERLTEFGQFGMILNYMLEENIASLAELERMFFDTDRDRASFIYQNLLRKMKEEDINTAYMKYSMMFPNNDGIDEFDYGNYLNKCCIRNILSIISSKDKLDQSYVNTYSFLLENDSSDTYVRK